nr:ankyrin repeat domain-containing protein [Legionella sainthelensi]
MGYRTKNLVTKRGDNKTKNRHGTTALHLAAKDTEILKIALALYPENHRPDALMVKNKYGDTILHKVVSNSGSLTAIIALVPVNQRLEAMMIQNKDGKTMLDSIVHDPKKLKTILTLLPTEIDYSNKNKEQTVLSSNIDILRISQIRLSFLSTAKENNSDQASKQETDLDPDILKILEKERIYEERLLSLGKEKLG